MEQQKVKVLIDTITSNPHINAIRVLTTSDKFQKMFDGNVSNLFRKLKNSKSSVGSISNRLFFKNLSGCYFSSEETELFEIIILYDSSISQLNKRQVVIRIKKLLGLSTKIEFGDFFDFEGRIREIIGTVRKAQTFGEFYFKKDKAIM
jgi:hypothetical protein